jgi:lipoprotein-anchoring transpeptidase ErfK/SrfK
VHPLRHRAAAAVLGLTLLAGVLAGCSSNSASPVDLPSTPTSVVAPGAAPTVAPNPDMPTSTTAVATGPSVAVFAQPGDPAPLRNEPNPWLYNNEPDAKVPLVYLVKEDKGDGWLEVYLSTRPNGSTGFIRRDQVTLEANPYRLEVRLGEFNLKAYKGTQLIMDTKVALGADDAPTPGGLYFLNVLIESLDPGYGPYAFGLSGYSEKITSFNGGDGQLGLHGTDRPELIGTRVSHGCIRLRNEDIVKLKELPLPLGTPIQILS